VISVFAIVILSILGFLFKGNHPELVGGEDDPEDGPAVAATVFTAVIIYAVRFAHPTPTPTPNPRIPEYSRMAEDQMDTRTTTLLTLALLGLPHLLRLPGPVAPTREPERRDRTIERAWRTGGRGIMAFGVLLGRLA
jgi:hypothetical protein